MEFYDTLEGSWATPRCCRVTHIATSHAMEFSKVEDIALAWLNESHGLDPEVHIVLLSSWEGSSIGVQAIDQMRLCARGGMSQCGASRRLPRHQ